MRRIILLALLFGCSALADTDPPTVIRIIRNAARGSSRGYAEAQAVIKVLGGTSVSGPAESWFFEMLDTFQSLEDLDRALPMISSGTVYSDDVITSATSMIGLYRSNLSHRWDEAGKIMPKARYFMVSIYRIRSGAQSGFTDLVRMRRARVESINFDQPELAYQIMSGAPSGTFVFITPLASLATFDDGLAKTPGGLKDPPAAEQKLAAEVEIGHEILLFRLDPKNSYVSEDFASADPEFWSVRPRK